MTYTMQLWSSLTDPVKAALVAGSLGIIGIIFTQAITTALQVWINSHRSRQERKTLEIRLQHERENFKQQIEHEKRKISEAIKREKIEALYLKFIILNRIINENKSLIISLFLQKSPDIGSCVKFIDSVNEITTDIGMNICLYFSDLYFDFTVVMLKTTEMTQRLHLIILKKMNGEINDINIERIAAENAKLKIEIEGNISSICRKMQEIMSIYIKE